jgi:hypothetical protein
MSQVAEVAAARQATPPGAEELSRLRTRALAAWLTVSGPADARRADLEPAATVLYAHADHLCAVVVAAGGQALARYRIVGHGQNWRLRREPPDGEPPALVCTASVVPGGTLDALARAADLRRRSVALAFRSAALRSRSAAALAHAEAAVLRCPPRDR